MAQQAKVGTWWPGVFLRGAPFCKASRLTAVVWGGGFDPHLGERFKLRLPIIFTSVRTGFWIRPVPRLWARARAAPGDEVPAGELGWAAVLPRACLSLEPGNKEQLGSGYLQAARPGLLGCSWVGFHLEDEEEV